MREGRGRANRAGHAEKSLDVSAAVVLASPGPTETLPALGARHLPRELQQTLQPLCLTALQVWLTRNQIRRVQVVQAVSLLRLPRQGIWPQMSRERSLGRIFAVHSLPRAVQHPSRVPDETRLLEDLDNLGMHKKGSRY